LDKFGGDDVGLITGDVSVNPDASCLIMTTGERRGEERESRVYDVLCSVCCVVE
jgi:hypothetical protein